MIRYDFSCSPSPVTPGLAVSTLSRIGNGIYKPRAEAFVRLLRWLEVDPDEVSMPPKPVSEDTMTEIRLLLRRDPALSAEAVDKLLRAWRPMYELYAESEDGRE